MKAEISPVVDLAKFRRHHIEPELLILTVRALSTISFICFHVVLLVLLNLKMFKNCVGIIDLHEIKEIAPHDSSHRHVLPFADCEH